jgi:hypothetical protein
MNHRALQNMMKPCIEDIRNAQLPDGSFLHQSSPAQDFSVDIVSYKSTFFTANILVCLNSVATMVSAMVPSRSFADLDDIRSRAAEFLVVQKSPHWSFNYWARDSKEATMMPYPDDLDDTFVALAALHGYDPSLIDGTVLASVAKMLTAVEVAPGGPYRTWLVASDVSTVAADTPDEWHDVDLVVNANVGNFLARLDIVLPDLDRFIRGRVTQKDLYSPYYPGSTQVEYFIARYLGNLPEWFAGWLEGQFMDKNYDHPYPFCIDPSRGGKTCYAGLAVMNAALYAEALAMCVSEKDSQLLRPPLCSPSETLLNRIKALARARSSRLAEPLREIVLHEIDMTQTEEIVEVPYVIHEALGKPQIVSSQLLDDLALANLHGWMAYAIYDDMLDGDKDEHETRLRLSAANFFLRELTACYIRLEDDIPGIGEYFSRLLDGIDSANAEEQLKQFGEIPVERLADRSLGHALPALAVLFASGAAHGSEVAVTAEIVLSFFRNYLIARQLHDDAHDWNDDLARSRLNSAAARLMAMHPTSGSDEQVDSSHLKKFFWREVIPVIVNDIKKYLNDARTDLTSLSKIGVLVVDYVRGIARAA